MTSFTDALARRRVPLGFAAGAIVVWLAKPTPRSLIVGGLLALVGEAIRVWAAGHLRKSREVTMSGPYRLVRHPLYFGSSSMGVGLALASDSFVAAGIIIIYLATTITAAIRREERFLREAFGDRYDQYQRGAAAADCTRRAFSVQLAIANREHRS